MSMTTPAETLPQERQTRRAMWRGWRRVCPSCGAGELMKSYLKVTDACPNCGEELHHQRADDGPAYLTILLVGKITMGGMVWAFFAYNLEPLALIGIFTPFAILLSLFLLPRFKGMLVGLQWALRMNGFGEADHG
jgi:uncharacterized protein (DUF983 family)